MENLDKYIENTFKGRRSKLVDLSDGRLHTEDGFAFPIHRYVLADKSQYFFALFCGIEKDKKEALIRGVKGEVLSSILTYIYTGEIRVTAENICDIIIAADYLLLEDLLLQTKTFLPKKISVANSLAIFTAALKINSGDIFKESLRFVEMHFEDIMRCNNKQFYELPLETLQQLLCDRSLYIRNENVIWHAIVEWISAYLPNRLPCVPDLLLCLALAEVNESLAKQILQHDFVARNASCQGICALKSTNPELNNLQILQHYAQNSTNPNSSLHVLRSPSKLQFVADQYIKNGETCTQIYVSYDEKFDYWRQILQVDGDLYNFLAVNDCIYMFGEFIEDSLRYSITEKRWLQFRIFRNPPYEYTPVKLNGFIYILGQFSNRHDTFDVEIYNPEDDTWYDTTPMPPVYNFHAVTLNDFIYVVGNTELDSNVEEVIAEVYNPYTEIWNVLPRPSINRSFCALAAYHEKLYLIGGTQLLENHSSHICKEVEVFDPANNNWSRAADLPYAYISPKAIVINDEMIVYDLEISPEDRSEITTRRAFTYPSVIWNVNNECWETTEGSISSTDKHMYNFFTLEDVEYVHVIAKENKDPETMFEKSPFS